MTREKAAEILLFMDGEFSKEEYEALNMAIEALEQEPYEDCISREKTCDYIAEFVNHEYSTQSECEMVDAMVEGIQHLPSVKQEPKTDGDCISRKDLLKKCVHVPIAPLIAGEKVYCEKVVFAMDIINAEPIKQEQKTDILDKIRAEIEQTFLDDGAMQEYTVERCLDIIDKYKEG